MQNTEKKGCGFGIWVDEEFEHRPKSRKSTILRQLAT